ncbi:MAG: phospholipase effector Tle1 domain-containing protein [Janthinobacterium lividum]
MSRKLLFFFDGTSRATAGFVNDAPTNMYRLNQVFTNGIAGEQISFYYAGVGTRDSKISKYTGRGFDQIVMEAYTNLASNYCPGDQIYLFGFSRGAVAARVLSGFLSNPGLLKEDRLSQDFPTAWRLYKNYARDTLDWNERDRLRGKLHGSLHQATRVRFLGVFDSVPGYSHDIKLRVRNCVLEECVDHAVQILAADDRRTPFFAPLLWDDKKTPNQTLEQIWLPGVHSDVGGSSDARFFGHLALLTMVERIQEHCPELEIEQGYVQHIEEEVFLDRPPIQITNECDTFEEKVLQWGRRHLQEHTMLHEVMGKLTGENIYIRRRRRTYRPRSGGNAQGVFTSKYTSQIDAAVEDNRKPAR